MSGSKAAPNSSHMPFLISHSYQMPLAVEDVTTAMEGQVRDAWGRGAPGQGAFSGPEITEDFLGGYVEERKHSGVCLSV